MAKTFKTEALVFKKNNLINRDQVITFFSKDLGKIRVFAKGIKKITSRRLPHTETGNLINILVQKKSDFFYLQETALITGFSKIKRDQKKINYLFFYFFILEKLLPENQKEDQVYNFIKRLLIELSETEFNIKKSTYYLNQLLYILGYSKENKPLPELKQILEEIINEKIPSLII